MNEYTFLRIYTLKVVIPFHGTVPSFGGHVHGDGGLRNRDVRNGRDGGGGATRIHGQPNHNGHQNENSCGHEEAGVVSLLVRHL